MPSYYNIRTTPPSVSHADHKPLCLIFELPGCQGHCCIYRELKEVAAGNSSFENEHP